MCIKSLSKKEELKREWMDGQNQHFRRPLICSHGPIRKPMDPTQRHSPSQRHGGCEIIWMISATLSGQYSAASANKVLFHGAIYTCMNKFAWEIWAPPKIKFFMWLAL
jgi:hypothetical protein